jgi:hypothetical protein
MTGRAVAQPSSVLLAVCTPWLVASSGPTRSFDEAAARDQAAGAVATSIATLIRPQSPWIVVIGALGFGAAAIVAFRVLGEIDDLTRPARQVGSAERTASLRPRKAGEYLPWSWRVAAAGRPSSAQPRLSFAPRAS